MAGVWESVLPVRSFTVGRSTAMNGDSVIAIPFAIAFQSNASFLKNFLPVAVILNGGGDSFWTTSRRLDAEHYRRASRSLSPRSCSQRLILLRVGCHGDHRVTFRVEGHGADGRPVARMARPTGRITRARRGVQRMPGRQNRVILARMPLLRTDIANATVAMIAVVPTDEIRFEIARQVLDDSASEIARIAAIVGRTVAFARGREAAPVDAGEPRLAVGPVQVSPVIRCLGVAYGGLAFLSL